MLGWMIRNIETKKSKPFYGIGNIVVIGNIYENPYLVE
jgi:hypothetical protein